MKKLFSALFLWIIALSSCKKKNEYKNLECGSVNSSYSAVIQPIITANCTSAGCHDARSANGNLTTYEGLMLRVNNGTLSKRVLYIKDMPKNGTLSKEERNAIKCWLDAGSQRN
jgi:hypothetical protein